jgi:hypothetical protein
VDYEDFSIRFEADGPLANKVGVRGGRGEATAPFAPPSAAAPGKQLGADLFNAVMAPAVRTLFDESLAASATLGHGLRIRLCFDRQYPRLAALCDLPWELMYRADREQFLALHLATPVVRHLAVPQRNDLPPVAVPLRVLVAAASPAGLPRLATEREQGAIQRLAAERGILAATLVARPTRDSLRRSLLEPCDVFHFIGHGGFDAATGDGCLVLDLEASGEVEADRDLLSAGSAEAESRLQGASAYLAPVELVRGALLACLLTGRKGPRLAVLNACNTAVAASATALPAFGGVAAALVLGGVPAVIAMQRPITDLAACAFSAALYERISAGESLEEAVAEARRAIHARQPDDFEWATPVLFLRLDNGRMFAQPDRPRCPTDTAPAQGPRNEVRVKVGTANGPVDIHGKEGPPDAGAAGEDILVVAQLETINGPLTVSGRKTGSLERDND